MSRYVLVEMPMPKDGGCHIAVDWDGHSFMCPIKRKTCDYFFTKNRPEWCPIKGEIQDNSIISISEGQIGYPVMQRDPRDFLNGRITGMSNVKL